MCVCVCKYSISFKKTMYNHFYKQIMWTWSWHDFDPNFHYDFGMNTFESSHLPLQALETKLWNDSLKPLYFLRWLNKKSACSLNLFVHCKALTKYDQVECFTLICIWLAMVFLSMGHNEPDCFHNKFWKHGLPKNKEIFQKLIYLNFGSLFFVLNKNCFFWLSFFKNQSRCVINWKGVGNCCNRNSSDIRKPDNWFHLFKFCVYT